MKERKRRHEQKRRAKGNQLKEWKIGTRDKARGTERIKRKCKTTSSSKEKIQHLTNAEIETVDFQIMRPVVPKVVFVFF